MKETEIYTERCPYCGKEHVQRLYFNTICPCGAKYYFNTREWLSRKPQTNADRIRAMSDEELVRWVGLDSCPKDAVCTLPVNCEKCWLNWLRQPAKDGDNE